MGAVMFGNGIAGIGSNILRALTLIIFPADDDPQNSFRGALTIFMIAFFVEALSVLAQVCLRKNAYANFYLKRIEHSEEPEASPLLGSSEQRLNNTQSTSAQNSVVSPHET